MKDNKLLKEAAGEMEATVRIGKSGLTEGIIKEIIKQLDRKKTVKIKCLKSFIADKDKKEVAEELARKTNSELTSRIGFTVVLHKR